MTTETRETYEGRYTDSDGMTHWGWYVPTSDGYEFVEYDTLTGEETMRVPISEDEEA